MVSFIKQKYILYFRWHKPVILNFKQIMSISKYVSFKIHKRIISYLINAKYYFTPRNQPKKGKTTFINICLETYKISG